MVAATRASAGESDGPEARQLSGTWDGIAAYCKPENTVVEGPNNKTCVLQWRGYAYRDEERLKLKIICAFLPSLPRGASRCPL